MFISIIFFTCCVLSTDCKFSKIKKNIIVEFLQYFLTMPSKMGSWAKIILYNISDGFFEILKIVIQNCKLKILRVLQIT